MTEMTSSPAVSVIVPLFNEEENMSILQSELKTALTDKKGSADGLFA